jgi:ABC-type phosphate transport system auxiliary subunit
VSDGFETLLKLWGAISPFAILAITLVIQRGKAARSEIQGKADAAHVQVIETRVAELEDRATRIESELEHLPDKDVSHRMELAIQQMKGEIAVLSERLKPVSAIGERLQEFLLEQAKVTR